MKTTDTCASPARVAVLAVLASACALGAQGSNPAPASGPAPLARVPIAFVRNQVRVPVSIEGSAPFVLILDTGMPTEPGYINGGMFQRQDNVNGPVITIDVDSIDDALPKVEANGGKTVEGKMAVGDMGFVAYVNDSNPPVPQRATLTARGLLGSQAGAHAIAPPQTVNGLGTLEAGLPILPLPIGPVRE